MVKADVESVDELKQLAYLYVLEKAGGRGMKER